MSEKETNIKTDIKKFVNKVLDKDYKQAHTHITDAVNKKIKQQMINNNTTLF
tara:strand:- start:690 stop:845 length:156 start_codon:yes stop_codon:yes gene_type:complete